MQTFHWSLLNSQEIKTVDNHLERRGDDIYQVTKSEHYVKLTFSRDLDLPNLKEIKRLEQEYFGLPRPVQPTLFPVHILVWIIGAFVYGLGIIGWLVYYFMSYKPKKEGADALASKNASRRQEIVAELQQYS
jgi:hypothetical protein